MSVRPAYVVRQAGIDDIEALTDLCMEARKENIASIQVCSPDRDRVAAQLRGLLGEVGSRISVCQLGDRLCGLLLTRFVAPSPFYEVGRLHIDAMFVDPSQRRRGVGHALLENLAIQAAAYGASEVVCVPLGGSRSAQRFFARIGFAPAAGYRIISTDSLVRRVQGDALSTTGPQPRIPRRRGLDELIAVRRRRRGDTGEIPIVTQEPVRRTLGGVK